MNINNHNITLVVPGPKKIQFGAIAHLPLAYLSLAAWLREKGGYTDNIKIVDTQITPLQEVQINKTRVLGITAMTGHQIKYGLEIAKYTRKINPETLIVWGGIHASLLPEETVREPLVDLVVIGEGEQTFLEIVNAVFNDKPFSGIPGTCFQNEKSEIIYGEKREFLNMDDLPLPAYDLINIKDYKGIQHQFDYQSSRGCPYRCGFCYNTVFCGRRYRKKSAEKVVKELISLKKKYGVENFGFVDDEFFIEKKRVKAIMEGIQESGQKFGIVASCRLDIVCGYPDSLLHLMKSTGVKQIFFGAESGSPTMLKDIQKDITREQMIEGAVKVAQSGIRPILSFMSGFPGETRKDLDATLDVITGLWNKHPLITINGIFPFNAYPGTMLYDRAVNLGFKPPENLRKWGNWAFQYSPDNPWLDEKRKQYMQIAFYMVRFKYYIARYEDRYKGKLRTRLLKLITLPLLLSLHIRLKNKWFTYAWEWKLFALLAKKTFGYL